MISPRHSPPCYCLYAFVHLPADQLPAPGSAMQIEYYTQKNGVGTCEKVQNVIFSKILTQEPNAGTPLAKSDWGILGFEENSTPSKCSEFANERLPTLIVTIGEMQRHYINIVIIPACSYREEE